jgi:hypothetical protein
VVVGKISDKSSWDIDRAQILHYKHMSCVVETNSSKHEFITDVSKDHSSAYYRSLVRKWAITIRCSLNDSDELLLCFGNHLLFAYIACPIHNISCNFPVLIVDFCYLH